METDLNILDSCRFFVTNIRPLRLLQEERGVKGPLWFGQDPESLLHVPANILRLLSAIIFAPIWLTIPHVGRSIEELIKLLVWSIEWANVPDAVLLESPGSLMLKKKEAHTVSNGKYAVRGDKPTFLLKVTFEGKRIKRQQQVTMQDWGTKGGKGGKDTDSESSQSLEAHPNDYTAISYWMGSARVVFDKLERKLDPQPEIDYAGNRDYSLRNRRNIAQALLDQYARARQPVNAGGEDVEYIWLDEFCLSDDNVPMTEEECEAKRRTELGRLSDIFRRAKQVVVFCHVPGCHHTDLNHCPWINRLFTLGEILHARQVLVMNCFETRNPNSKLDSRITNVLSGHDFRTDIQACASRAERWHLYNIMQHATNSGAIPWQSAIHSLLVEAIRRDETDEEDKFRDHNMLGRALNGLLPRKAELSDLKGVNGWEDLAWLLELNQGFYNCTLLAAVCEVAAANVPEYRWWGRPSAPQEGTERLEALVTSIPVKLRLGKRLPPQPALSIIGPQSVPLTHWLQRDSRALYHRPEVKSLKRWTIGIAIILILAGFISFSNLTVSPGLPLIWATLIAFVIIELLVGTIFVQHDVWFVVEDHTVVGRNVFRWLQSQDPSLTDAGELEWGPRQLIPEWGFHRPKQEKNRLPEPVPVTLMDLRTGGVDEGTRNEETK
ncbi:hypothetical protein NP233_g7788 [Leucocoprinus birnbaumii]|uniref:Heterokaryon incompatibility domain-containing protein n=1 Tax=Leucocoprinus birnbaumii TaxID=56174 RepID=A0AAD5VQ58_9AGAR|nr:hypothetical protein NP233_g7788 [Leucocoprinus birnbaumii]